jgi:hypothetical protein
VPLENIPLHIPLVNLISADDLRIASVKVREIHEMIREQEQKFNQDFFLSAVGIVPFGSGTGGIPRNVGN